MSDTFTNPVLVRISAFLDKIAMQSEAVPELGGEVIYWKPPTPHSMTIAMQIAAGSSQAEFDAVYVGVNALTETGVRMFSNAEAMHLATLKVGMAFSRIAEKMKKATPISDLKP